MNGRRATSDNGRRTKFASTYVSLNVASCSRFSCAHQISSNWFAVGFRISPIRKFKSSVFFRFYPNMSASAFGLISNVLGYRYESSRPETGKYRRNAKPAELCECSSSVHRSVDYQQSIQIVEIIDGSHQLIPTTYTCHSYCVQSTADTRPQWIRKTDSWAAVKQWIKQILIGFCGRTWLSGSRIM